MMKKQIYEGKEKLEDIEGSEKFLDFWRDIYGGKECKIEEIWNTQRKNSLKNEFEEERLRHIWSVRRGEQREDGIIIPMSEVKMKREELKIEIEKMKMKKAAGPNKLKAELFREIYRVKGGKEMFLRGINKTLMSEEAPEIWEVSETI